VKILILFLIIYNFQHTVFADSLSGYETKRLNEIYFEGTGTQSFVLGLKKIDFLTHVTSSNGSIILTKEGYRVRHGIPKSPTFSHSTFKKLKSLPYIY